MIHTGVDSQADLGESEPPHIKNWFSSYEYESFVLETNDNFGFSEHQESQDYKNECSTGNTTNSKENLEESVTNAKNESLLIKHNESEEENTSQKHDFESQDSPLLTPEPAGIDNWFSSYAYESPEVDTIDDLIASDHKESIVDCNEKIKEFEKDENLCVTATDYMVCKQVFDCDNGSLKDDNKLTDLANEDVNANEFENGSRKVEEDENGFVSIKSKKIKYEKSTEVKGVGQERYVFSSLNNNKKKKSDERVRLRDVTNVVDENSSVTGKWKCPRKRKSDIGPPMKQLRLRQWFRHV